MTRNRYVSPIYRNQSERQPRTNPTLPRWMDARFNSACQCGEAIAAGSRIFWEPLSKRAWCEACGVKVAEDHKPARWG